MCIRDRRGEVARRNRRAVIVEGQLAGHQDHHFCPQVDLHALGVVAKRAVLKGINAFDHPVSYTHLDVYKRQVFKRIQQVLEAAGAGLDDVVKALFFLTDASKYSEVSAVRNQYFATARPASAMVEISNTVAAGCDVEIEVMAMIDKPAGGSHE